MSQTARIPIGTVEIPTSILQMLNGTSSFCLFNDYFKIPTQKPYTKWLTDQEPQGGSKVVLNLSPPVLLHRGHDGKFTDAFTFILSNSERGNNSDTFVFRSPYSEMKAVKKSLECKCQDSVMNKLCERILDLCKIL